MKWLQNPIVLKAAFTFFLSCFFVLLGIVLMRRAKRAASVQIESPRLDAQHPGFSLAAYEGVITKLKEQERELERLRRSETERARETTTVNEAIISNLVSGVVLFNTAMLVRQANPAARNLLGYASPSSMHARAIFKSATAIRFADTRTNDQPAVEQLVSAVQESIADGKNFRRVELDHVTPGGDKRVLGVTISPVRLPSGERLGAACLITDLTDIARLSEQVKLQENMAALGEMSAGIAHEFKNSLATISGYAQMLAAKQAEADSDFASRIVSETDNLSRIVSDFLNFARPQGGAREPLDLTSLLEDCAHEAGVNLDLHSLQDETFVLGDPTALRQAFSNLFRNAAEAAAGPAAVTAKMLVTASDHIVLDLIDNGGGIAPDHLAKIFIPFFTTKAKGTGLGLALVHRVVTEQGGKIAVESPFPGPGGATGTKFTLTLPRSASS